MSFWKPWKVISNWNTRKEKSDLKRVRVTSSGAFYMKSEDIFNDKAETLELLNKLDKSVENYKKSFAKSYTSAD